MTGVESPFVSLSLPTNSQSQFPDGPSHPSSADFKRQTTRAENRFPEILAAHPHFIVRIRGTIFGNKMPDADMHDLR
jgi:hypothetical protein